jgi:TusA-related sulfurtransferase
VKEMRAGEVLEMIATDANAMLDMEARAKQAKSVFEKPLTGHFLSAKFSTTQRQRL